MLNDIIGVFLSVGFVILIIVISEILKKKANWTNEATRKFIHIGVSHWWILAMVIIDKIQFAIIPPILFIILNYISYKKDLIKSMERNEGKSDLGTVYFPISLLTLILITWSGGFISQDIKYLGAIGILIMGYGDGFAAVIGKKFGERRYKVINNSKTIEGSIAMLIFSFFVTLVLLVSFNGFSIINIQISLVIGVAATLLEAFTPYGLDNLSVPILSTLISYYLLFIIKDSSTLDFYYRGALGLIFSSIIAYVAYQKKSLTLSGSIGAIVMGVLIFASGGLYSSVLMILFFVSSSILSHFKKSKKSVVSKQFDKTGNRDIFQVFANGGVGLIYSLIYFYTDNSIFLILIGIAFAAANADTWATELGVLNNREPISLRTFRRVDKGTSGAISGLGTLAALLGSTLIGFVSVIALVLSRVKIADYSLIDMFLFITLGGFLGGMIDSMLGATIQGIYYSEDEGKETEKAELNGKPTTLIRGYTIFNNDIINFLSIATASLVFLLIIK